MQTADKIKPCYPLFGDDDYQASLKAKRDLYEEAMTHVGLLRGKHIELLEWAMKSSRSGWQLAKDADNSDTWCRSFLIVLDDGAEVIPYRIRPRGQTYAASSPCLPDN